MSQFSYNNVTIPYAFHVQFRQEAVYDEMGNTDWFCTKFDIQIQGILHADYLSLIAPDLVGVATSPTEIMNVIRSRLLQPRQRLSVTTNGIELIPQQQDTNIGTVDAQNGPKPQACSITSITNTSFLINYHVIAHYWENIQVQFNKKPLVKNLKGHPILYNRWSETSEFDILGNEKRTRAGKFVMRSDNFEGEIIDNYRHQMAVIGVLRGFIRESASYTVDPSGLGISYRVVDKEVFRMPPEPAYEADGEYIELCTRHAALRYGEVRVRLKANANIEQRRILEVAVATATETLLRNQAEVDFLAPVANKAPFRFSCLESMAVRVNLYENEVECRMRVRLEAKKQNFIPKEGKAPIPGFSKRVTEAVAFSDFNYTPSYPSWGDPGMLVKAAAYYDPDILGTRVDKEKNQLSRGFEVGEAGHLPE